MFSVHTHIVGFNTNPYIFIFDEYLINVSPSTKCVHGTVVAYKYYSKYITLRRALFGFFYFS